MKGIITNITLVTITLFLFACNNNNTKAEGNNATVSSNNQEYTTADSHTDTIDGNYFSILQYLNERQEDEKNQPYVLLKIVKHNNNSDSTFVPLDQAWQEMKGYFADADISDKKFLNHYEAQVFEDDLTQSIFLQYRAKSDDKVLRKMDIAINPKNERIKSVYIEMNKKEESFNMHRKILYTPENLLQIQNVEKNKNNPSDSKETTTEYHYEY